ncbi:hypothetical protein ABMX48_36415, partial [Streptomyces cavourensis]
ITTLAAGVTHRRWDGIGAARLTLTIGWALFLLLLSLLIYGAALRAGNTSAKEGPHTIRHAHMDRSDRLARGLRWLDHGLVSPPHTPRLSTCKERH